MCIYIIPKCLDPQRTVFQRNIKWRADMPPLWNILNWRLQLSVCGTREQGIRGQLKLLRRILKQFRKSCICIYSPCDSDFWQLQSDWDMACFRSIKTKRHLCFGAFCCSHLVAIWWCFILNVGKMLHSTELKN